MEQPQAILFLKLLLPPKQSHQRNDSPHVVGIGIAGRRLVNQTRLFDASLRRDGQHDGGNLIDRRDVED